MKQNKRVLLIDSVIILSRTNPRPRERRGIDTIIENKKYHPYMVITEPVLLNKPMQFLRTKSFLDSRIETYYVPSFAIGSLASNRTLGKIGKLMFGICNLMLQAIYVLHLTMLVLCLVLAKKIEIMHAHNPPDLTGIASLLVSKITNIPYVFEIHDRAPELYCELMGFSESSFVFKLMKSIEYLVVTNSKGIITVNKHVAAYFKQYGGPAPIYIYTGTKVGKNEIRKTSLGNSRVMNHRIILFQGTLNMATIGGPSIYDLELPLKAMPYILKNFPNAILVYVGEGSGRPKLEKRSRLMGLDDKVIFTGFVSQKQVFDWINKAEVVLIPFANSPNNHTTVPSKIYEYMAIGKPIVATRFPGILEILEHECNALLYSVNSLNDFTKCVLRLFYDSKLAEKLASKAQRDFISRYSQEKNWPKLISLYDSILETK
jgi:glycosyltransferase involved in cell wall biosynthesis